MRKWSFLVVVFFLLLCACGSGTPEATPTAGAATPAVPLAQAPTLPPAQTPLPTLTPMPLPAPHLSLHRPAPGEEQPLEAAIELAFDQPMDAASVESSFVISPTVAGTLAWIDDRTLTFSAAHGLQRGVRYEVTVDGSARNVEGTALGEPVVLAFDTVGYLNVSQVVPAPGSDELEADTVVTVVFDRPVVPLTAISGRGELPQPLTFVPPVRGVGEWLNTSIYQFRPEQGFLPATDYKARVAAGLVDTTGGILQEDYRWEFSTLRPAILEVQPSPDEQYAGPTSVISVTFNQPVDRASVQAHFSLRAVSGRGSGSAAPAVPGSFRWRGGRTATDSEMMIFVPDEPLARGTEWRAEVKKGVLAAVGAGTNSSTGAGTIRSTGWTFRTVNEPGILATYPRDGDKDVDPGDGLYLTFSSPMEREGFVDRLSITLPVSKVYAYWSEHDSQVRVSFKQEPASSYSISLDAGTPDKYGAPLGKVMRVRFTTGDLEPQATLVTDGRLGSFNAYTDTVVLASHRNVSRLELSLYQLNWPTFVDLNTNWEAWNKYQPQEGDLVRRWVRKVAVPRNELGLARLNLVDGAGDPLPPGLYYLELSAPQIKAENAKYRPSHYMFVKSYLNLTLKHTSSEVLVWATDLASGQPVAGLPMTLSAASENSTATTDADGLFLVEDLEIKDLWQPLFVIAGEPGDDDFGLAYNAWDEGISPWDFGVHSAFWASQYQAYLYTDRPIYRPGQTVYFKGILRADDDAHYSIPAQIETLEVEIHDPQGKELYQEKLPLSDMGSLHDHLVLDGQAPLGSYHIELRDPAREFYAHTSFQVAEYKKPEYEVTVDTDRDAYLAGDAIDLSAGASYYFGGPVADADVHWSLLSSRYSFRHRCPPGEICPRYSWTDYEWGSYEDGEEYDVYDYGRLLAEGDARTDEAGRVTFEVPADPGGQSQSQVFTLEATVTDLNGQQVSNRTAAVVHRGEFYAGVAPRGYLAQAGEEKQVDLLAVGWDSAPVTGVDLTVVFMEHHWYSVKKQAEDGHFYWDWTSEDIPVLTTTVTTGRDGQAVVAFTPDKAGSYKVQATGRDSHENEIRSAAYFWVWGGEEYVSWRQESSNRIELVADKEEYQVGDVAEILVPSPYSGTVQALVTYERGHIMEAEVRTLESNSGILRVPIRQDHVPNVFVTVLIVQGSEQAPDRLSTFKMGMVKLPVSVASKELTIALTPDKDMMQGESYSPRQTATFDVLVTDHEGKPVDAELSLRLADEAVLALADEPGRTLAEQFWRDRGVGVRTSLPLVVAMEAFNRELSPGAKGGGGGGDGLVRSQFADVAFWDPVLRTGQDGRAQVTVRLPDNLTTWQMQARGITADTLVGRAEVDVRSSLDLLLRPVLPRFFVAGDRAEIATIVHNNTDSELEVQAAISVEGLAVEGETTQMVRVPAGDKAQVIWPIEALPGDQVRVRMSATAGDLYDAREDTLPVYRYSTPEVVATAGQLPEPGLRQEIVQLPAVMDPTLGDLSVQVDGSLTAATQDALAYLEHYPYECTEQTVSRFLPNVMTWQALEEMGLDRPELRQKLAQMVGLGLQQLYAGQHYDGGWGWWVNDESDPYLTAYVIQGMMEAHHAGFTVDAAVMDKAADFLHEELPSVGRLGSHWQANRLAYQLYVLAAYADTFEWQVTGELGTAIRLFEKRHLLDNYGRATLAVALALLEPEEAARVETLLGDLVGDAIVSATGTHWQEAEPDYWNMNTDVRTTAVVLWALGQLQPDDALLPGTVRWLMAARQEGYWGTTQATAWALLGLVEYMRASGELQGDFGYTVYLNGEEWASGDVSRDNIDESRKLQVEIARLLVDEANRLVIERHPAQAGQTGEGQLYYSTYLRYYLPADHVQALDRGIVVARQYSLVDDPARSVDEARVGDVVKVKLTLIASADLYYLVVEDPLPAGFEGVDLSLKTSSAVGERPELRSLNAEEEGLWYRRYGWGWWWFSHSEMRDEKVALFARYLPRGTYEYTYLMRASVPGEFLVIPTTAYQMYFPEVFGRSDGGKFIIERAD